MAKEADEFAWVCELRRGWLPRVVELGLPLRSMAPWPRVMADDVEVAVFLRGDGGIWGIKVAELRLFESTLSSLWASPTRLTGGYERVKGMGVGGYPLVGPLDPFTPGAQLKLLTKLWDPPRWDKPSELGPVGPSRGDPGTDLGRWETTNWPPFSSSDIKASASSSDERPASSRSTNLPCDVRRDMATASDEPRRFWRVLETKRNINLVAPTFSKMHLWKNPKVIAFYVGCWFLKFLVKNGEDLEKQSLNAR